MAIMRNAAPDETVAPLGGHAGRPRTGRREEGARQPGCLLPPESPGFRRACREGPCPSGAGRPLRRQPLGPAGSRWASAGPCPRYGSGVREGRTARTRRPRLGLGVILRHRPQPLPLRRDAGGAAAGAAGGGAHGVRVQQRVVPTPYADNGVRGWAREQRFGRRPYQRAASRPSPRLVGPTDGTSHLCVAAAPDAALLPRVRRGAEALDLARCEAAPRRSTWPCPREAPGTRSTHWAAASASGGCTKRRSSTPTR